jgi:MFS transporter, DHA1 family, multidrug resistance protein
LQKQPNPLGAMLRLAISREVLPLLMVVATLNLGPAVISPALPLVIREISHNSAASVAGMAMGLVGLITMISSLVFGKLTKSFPVQKILVFCCIGTGLLFLPPIWAHSELQIILLIGITGLLQGGIVTSSNSLVSLTVPAAQQGIAYGLSQSANSLGSAAGPFIGGGLAPIIGLRPIFGVAAAILVLVGILTSRLIPERSSPVIKESGVAEGG